MDEDQPDPREAGGQAEAILMTDEVNPDLAQRVEWAEGASRELDAEIAVALRLVPFFNPGIYAVPLEYAPDEPRGPGHIGVWAIPGDGTRRLCHSRPAPHYTASLDAALTLLPAGWFWCVNSNGIGWAMRYDFEVIGKASTPALALCAAAIRARAMENGNG